MELLLRKGRAEPWRWAVATCLAAGPGAVALLSPLLLTFGYRRGCDLFAAAWILFEYLLELGICLACICTHVHGRLTLFASAYH